MSCGLSHEIAAVRDLIAQETSLKKGVRVKPKAAMLACGGVPCGGGVVSSDAHETAVRDRECSKHGDHCRDISTIVEARDSRRDL
jgi:hypothetical protein